MSRGTGTWEKALSARMQGAGSMWRDPSLPSWPPAPPTRAIDLPGTPHRAQPHNAAKYNPNTRAPRVPRPRDPCPKHTRTCVPSGTACAVPTGPPAPRTPHGVTPSTSNPCTRVLPAGAFTPRGACHVYILHAHSAHAPLTRSSHALRKPTRLRRAPDIPLGHRPSHKRRSDGPRCSWSLS